MIRVGTYGYTVLLFWIKIVGAKNHVKLCSFRVTNTPHNFDKTEMFGFDKLLEEKLAFLSFSFVFCKFLYDLIAKKNFH